jgi:hypothetical protein
MASNTPLEPQQSQHSDLLDQTVTRPLPEQSGEDAIEASLTRWNGGEPLEPEQEGDPTWFKAILDNEFWERDVLPSAVTTGKNLAANIAGLPSDMVGLMAMAYAMDPVKGAMIKSRLGVESVWDIPEKVPGNSRQLSEMMGSDPDHLSMLLTGLAAPGPLEAFTGAKAMFVGAVANARVGGRLGKLDDFLRMSNEKDIYDQRLWEETGWYRTEDGKPRFFISDADAKVDATKIFNRVKNEGLPADGKPVIATVGDILDHEELFELYPQIRNMRLQLHLIKRDGKLLIRNAAKPGTGANVASIGNTLTRMNIYNQFDEVGLRKAVLHEVQHVIQTLEGFATGGSVTSMSQQHIKQLLVGRARLDAMEAIRGGADTTDDLFLKLVDNGMDEPLAATTVMDSDVSKYLAATRAGETDFLQVMDSGHAGDYNHTADQMAHLVHYLGLKKDDSAQLMMDELAKHKGVLDEVRQRAYLMSLGEAEARLTERLHIAEFLERVPNPNELPDVQQMAKKGKTLSVGPIKKPGKIAEFDPLLGDVPVVDPPSMDQLSGDQMREVLEQLTKNDPELLARVLGETGKATWHKLPESLKLMGVTGEQFNTVIRSGGVRQWTQGGEIGQTIPGLDPEELDMVYRAAADALGIE